MTNEDISATAYNYGRNFELRKRSVADNSKYQEYDALCMALFRELQDVGVMDRFGILSLDYESDFRAGRDSVSEF